MATPDTNKIDVFDAYSLDLITSIENVGRAPIGMAFNAGGTQLFVNGFLSRSVLVYDVAGILAGTNNHAQLLAEVPAVAQEKLPALVLEGKRIFYNANDRRMNRDSYLSCASCHLDGEEDGRVWDFTDRGKGLRNTIALVGRRGTGHGRVHWSANFDEIAELKHCLRRCHCCLLDEKLAAGSYLLRWQGKNFVGKPAGTGIYIMCLRYETSTGKMEETVQRLLLIK